MQYGSYITKNYIYMNLISKVILSIAMVYIAFTPKSIKSMFKYVVIFYLTSFVFGGCAFFLLYYIRPQEILYKNGLLSGTYPIKIAFLGAIVGFVIISIAFKVIKNRLSKNDMFCDVEVIYKNNITSFKAMIDTGNLLKDPITRVPVIVVEKEKLKEIIEEEILEKIEKIVYGTSSEVMDEIGEDYISRLKLIPFSSLGKQNGMLVGFRPDEVTINFDGTSINIKDVIIGIYNSAICRNGLYSGLVGLELLEGSDSKNEYIENFK